MPTAAGRLRRFVFRISNEETTFARRGFAPGDPARQTRLEGIGRVFLDGYRAAVEADVVAALALRLDETEPELRGFAFEGAAMALALRDALSLRRGWRLQKFLDEIADPHIYTAHVGAGWALSRIPKPLRGRVSLIDPLLRWLALDGRGFHDAYFGARRAIGECAVPTDLTGYGRRAYDQGIGRCLWFHGCADPVRVVEGIVRFPEARRADLWSGVGLACAYAGGAEPTEVDSLVVSAGKYRAHLAQGVAFAAKAHERAGLTLHHTENAARAVGATAASLAAACDDALCGLGPDTETTPAYETWRVRVRSALTARTVETPALRKLAS